MFQKRIVVLDAGSFDNKYVIRSESSPQSLSTVVTSHNLIPIDNYPSVGYPCNPIALGTRWLAFSETKVSEELTFHSLKCV